jgi:hypothetical protein
MHSGPQDKQARALQNRLGRQNQARRSSFAPAKPVTPAMRFTGKGRFQPQPGGGATPRL